MILPRFLCDFTKTDAEGRYTSWSSLENGAISGFYHAAWTLGEHIVLFDATGATVEAVIEGSRDQLVVARPLGKPTRR
jgi:hypothetical protein